MYYHDRPTYRKHMKYDVTLKALFYISYFTTYYNPKITYYILKYTVERIQLCETEHKEKSCC